MEKFRTKDIYEACALIATNVSLVGLEADNGFYWFVFGSSDSCLETSNAYWANNLKVLAKDYADAIRSLKDRLFSQPQFENRSGRTVSVEGRF